TVQVRSVHQRPLPGLDSRLDQGVLDLSHSLLLGVGIVPGEVVLTEHHHTDVVSVYPDELVREIIHELMRGSGLPTTGHTSQQYNACHSSSSFRASVSRSPFLGMIDSTTASTSRSKPASLSSSVSLVTMLVTIPARPCPRASLDLS